MKNVISKYKFVVILAVSFITMTGCFAPAYAQRGEKALGIGGGYATRNHSGIANVFFQYSFSRNVRLAADVGYIFRHEEKTGIEGSVDVHFPFRVARAFKIYPLVGATFNNWNTVGPGGSRSSFGLDAGGGMDLYLTSNLKLNLQGKYSWLQHDDGGFFTLGIAYVF